MKFLLKKNPLVGDSVKRFLDFQVTKAEGEERTYWFTASTGTRDRMGDIIVQSGWRLKDFQNNPVILWGHKYGDPPIGKATEIDTSSGKLRLKIQFASHIYPFAKIIEDMVAERFCVAGSVGFSVYKVEDLNEEDKKSRPEMAWGKRLFGDLLEFSIVSVPANAEALSDRRGLADMLTKGFGFDLSDEESDVSEDHPLLPCKDADSVIDPRKLTAAFGALFGARGGVPVAEADRKACHFHLARMATEVGIVPWEFRDYTADELRELCADVWHDELLTLIEAGLDDDTRAVAKSFLLKGARRAEIQATVNHLQKLLDATEDGDIAEPTIEERFARSVEALTETISKVAAA